VSTKFVFKMDDGAVVEIVEDEPVDLDHVLHDHLGQRCSIWRTGDEQPDESNCVMVNVLILVDD
jgi:hypothetical protein